MTNTKIEILCTLGPTSFNEQVIKRLDGLGVSLFRVNLSDTKAQDLPAIIETIQAYTDVPICLDTEGAQVRTGDFDENQIELRENSIVCGYRRKVLGDAAGYDVSTACHGPASNSASVVKIDGTQVRDSLRDGKSIPDWMMREVVQESLRAEAAKNRTLFVE